MKFLVGLALVILSSGAFAQWSPLVSTDASSIYISRESIRKEGESVRMWRLMNYHAVRTTNDGKTYRSAKQRDEYDCRQEKLRPLASVFLSGNMGEGVTVASLSDPGNWGPVVPGSSGEALWKVACQN